MRVDFVKSAGNKEEKVSGKTCQNAQKSIIDHHHLPPKLQILPTINAVIKTTIAKILQTNTEQGQLPTDLSSSQLPMINQIATSHSSLK